MITMKHDVIGQACVDALGLSADVLVIAADELGWQPCHLHVLIV